VPDRSVDFLLIGGFAAAHCAKALREGGAEGSILLVSREPDPPYERPPLSKEYLRGEASKEDAFVVPTEWWAENDVELLTRTSVMKLDPAERVAKLSSKEEVGFGKALIATGANVRRLRVDGADLEGIHYLRAFGNSDGIREDAQSAETVVMVGGSYIGCEVAAGCAAMGKKCHVLMQEQVTFDRIFGEKVGRHIQGVLEEHGVEFHGGDELERFEGDERVAKVVTKGGREIDCDMAVVGVGVMPDSMLGKAAGLELGESGGIKVSERLETSMPGVYAAGDVAEYDCEIFGPVRVEHWDVARTHGITAARNMLGGEQPHTELPYFFSDLNDWLSLEYVGRGSGEPVIRGSLEEGEFSAFYLDGDGRVRAALSIGRSDDLEQAKRLINAEAAPEAAALADISTELSSL
jgi:3-phenylpropionate/trans-cinnamate dioxygenase ferredoxin reductase subunit